MPVYKFYCRDCHAVYRFFSRTVNTSKRPACPGCGRTGLDRRMSSFAITRAEKTAPAAVDKPSGLDDQKLERAMADLAREAENLSEGDPRQMARLLRKLHQHCDMPLDAKAEEAIDRMELGENPERVEEELGDVLGGESSGISKLATLSVGRRESRGGQGWTPTFTIYEHDSRRGGSSSEHGLGCLGRLVRAARRVAPAD